MMDDQSGMVSIFQKLSMKASGDQEDVAAKDEKPYQGSTNSSDSGGSALGNKFARSWMTSPPVKISIGDCPRIYYVNYQPLVEKSEYFKACLSSGFKESSTLEVRLDFSEEYRDPFEHFIQFLYYGDYNIPNEVLWTEPIPQNAAEEAALAKRCKEQLLLHARIYALCDRLCADVLKKRSCNGIKTIFHVARRYVHPTMLNTATRVRLVKGCSKNGDAGFIRLEIYNQEWREWHNTDNVEGYRDFCLKADKNPHTGIDPKVHTLFKPEDVTEVARIIYEETPLRVDEKDSARAEISEYCGRFVRAWKSDKAFMEYLFENKEFGQDVIRNIEAD